MAQSLESASRESLQEQGPTVEAVTPRGGFVEIDPEIATPRGLIMQWVRSLERLGKKLGRAKCEVNAFGCDCIGKSGRIAEKRPIASTDALLNQRTATQAGNARGIKPLLRTRMWILSGDKPQDATAHVGRICLRKPTQDSNGGVVDPGE
jgi:hypothetical protein